MGGFLDGLFFGFGFWLTLLVMQLIWRRVPTRHEAFQEKNLAELNVLRTKQLEVLRQIKDAIEDSNGQF